MAADKEIKITIDLSNYGLSTEASGYKNRECTQDVDSVLQAIGATTISRKLKPDLVRNVTVNRIKR